MARYFASDFPWKFLDFKIARKYHLQDREITSDYDYVHLTVQLGWDGNMDVARIFFGGGHFFKKFIKKFSKNYEKIPKNLWENFQKFS